MGAINWFIRRAMQRRLRQAAQALANPAVAQEQLLLRLVRRAADTEWGRAHGYAAIRSVADFQRAVPVCGYEEMAPLWHTAFDGARDVCWPGHIRFFALSSGTTAETCKALPVSREAIRANFRSGLTLMGLVARQAPQADVLRGKTLYFGGSPKLEPRGQCLQGDASGITALHIPRLARRYRLPEPDIASIPDWEQKVEAVAQRYLRSPITTLVGLPSWTLFLFRRLIDLGREELGPHVRTVADVWPGLRVFIHFGMAFEPYRAQFRELVGRSIAYVDTYSSSEAGMTAIQCDQADPAMLMEVDVGAFYEFVPVAELGRPQPTRLTLDQVETGQDYAVLLSTCSGIWAYDVGDLVRFTALGPPKLVVSGRTRLTLNALGEHVIGGELEAAVAAACLATGATVREYTVSTILPTAADPSGAHHWLVEFDGAPPTPDEWIARVDASLIEKNLDYKIHRDRGYAMRPPVLTLLAPGTFYEWARRHGQLGGQHKIPRVARTQEMVDELLAISNAAQPR
ncbi:MAG TPA: GH3 auxin-responsive promoter family protein [Planctomycetota bacterium]|nr:GH3 auxin-responsive promoter family protein [Planctomycetota bacterium]HRR79096.1 GH3 auxin-responsive promoter family protein [Planctomycetota bacterium]HRT93171.1 GH3 auxin-responsive promoter family protein [Planctomycetota bacterium]